MTRRALVLLALLLPAVAFAQQQQGFDHARHSKLFPTCTGCHTGVPSGDASRTYPTVAQCRSCHDGRTQPTVPWTPPGARGAGLLVYSHATHAQRVGKDVTCTTCHALGDGGQWMNVARAAPERCLACHAHPGSAHLADDNQCATCHRPLAAAVGLSDQRVAALPKPPSHSRTDFLSEHGVAARDGIARCAMCHARESCARCHVDAARSPTIAALAPDPRVARLVAGRAPQYPTPGDHRRAGFISEHGAMAKASIARCAACHAQPSCASCHTGEGARSVVSQLPSGAEAAGRGVQLGSVRVHVANFVRAHGTPAAAQAMTCTGCHVQQYCSDCHAGERNTRRYHPSNFVSRHAPEAYSRDVECSSCHKTETFCRDCHTQTGRGAKAGLRTTAYHNAQPQWLLRHGQAARQELTACTTCHQQTYCMQCHSDVGWRISPHGADFDAASMRRRNPSLCLFCHFKDPLGGK